MRHSTSKWIPAALLAASLTAPAQAPDLAHQIQALLADPAVSRAHWGIDVTDLNGQPLFVLNEAQYFQPASNAKIYTTITAMALLGRDRTFTTRIAAHGTFTGTTQLKGDLVLIGDGDANLSARTIPYLSPKDRPRKLPGAPEPSPLRHLEQMADTVAATGLKLIDGDVVGDDTLFPWEPYPADWAIDDAVWGYGAPVSALTITDNQLVVTVTPATTPGSPPTVHVDPAAPAYYTLDTAALTTGAPKSGSHVQMERAVGSRVLRIFGAIAPDAPPDIEEVAIQDPAEYAAIALKSMLEARGIRITGVARAQHRISTDPRGFVTASAIPPEEMKAWPSNLDLTNSLTSITCTDPSSDPTYKLLAQHQSVPLIQDVVVTDKVSQNLHAELLLEQVSRRFTCSPTRAYGARMVRELMLRDVQLDPDDFVFFDGSGLSGHDLVTPRATAKLLSWAATQPWFAAWKRALPIGGEDGSLASRFPTPPLKDHVFAKTGTLGEARALSGYLDTASGKTVIFSIMVDNHTPRTAADRDTMDRIVAAIAAAN
jgi:D-alanyl-D-alanine carboxypeptidase/D-alanyl-D-alanine-endopeptidase (penicillin-binding protein 4)